MPRPSPLHVEQILAWADDHFARTGDWPHTDSGPILDFASENWRRIDNALRDGLRELMGGLSLPKPLARERCASNPSELPP